MDVWVNVTTMRDHPAMPSAPARALRYAAFTERPEGGNPAAVVLDAATMHEPAMQALAARVGYSETAFLRREPGETAEQPVYSIRYFTPEVEVPFCGHATIAAAVALAERDGPGPVELRAPAGRLSSRLLPVVGPLLPLLVAGMQPWRTLLAPAVPHRSAGDVRRMESLAAVVGEFAGHDWGWFRHLAVAAADHAPLDLSPLSCPVTFLAGRYDTLVDARDMRAAAEGLPGARYRDFPGTHFLPLQYPELMLDEVRLLTEACSARA